MEITFCSEKVTELAKAMINVQQALTPAFKDAVNTFTNSSYATLKSVMDVCREIVLQNGIWLIQYPVPVEIGHLGLVTKIIHAATGQWQSSMIVMPLPKNDPQGYGSAMTYARRYGVSAILGIITEDDDAESAMQRELIENHGPVQNDKSDRISKQDPQYSSTGENLPHLDGVRYKRQTVSDGKLCIIATGNTHSKKEFLKTAGFRWDGDKKVWWRYADAA